MLARLAVSETSVLRASGGAVPDPALDEMELERYPPSLLITGGGESVTLQWTAASYHLRSRSLIGTACYIHYSYTNLFTSTIHQR
jgi:hypothetical protein